MGSLAVGEDIFLRSRVEIEYALLSNTVARVLGLLLALYFIYRVIHKSLQDFQTRQRNNQDTHSRKEHINR
jgi:predicted histidine transporter YuiF (NhaC family)